MSEAVSDVARKTEKLPTTQIRVEPDLSELLHGLVGQGSLTDINGVIWYLYNRNLDLTRAEVKNEAVRKAVHEEARARNLEYVGRKFDAARSEGRVVTRVELE